ncbi:biliverdin-producing heme oxygenase [Paracraurococcus ruber]|nr:biliverdin-producing heme oxygenase [Paracraurococcus ruber]
MPAAHLAGPAAIAAPLPLSARLRAETQDLHDRIETNPRFARLMAPDLGLAEYRGLVAALLGHHAAAEAAVALAGGLLPRALDLDRRLTRSRLLAEDLRALGLAEDAIAALPRCPGYSLRSAEAAWGTLYVLEGSALGGQLIARHLAAVLGLSPAHGCAGMVPHGGETGLLWRGFKQLLDDAARADALDPAAVVAAARHAFDTLDRWVAAA